MRILHISNNFSGGASRAALRLHMGLLNQGIDSKFLTLSRFRITSTPEVYNVKPYQKSRLTGYLDRVYPFSLEKKRQHNLRSKSDSNFEIFSFPQTEYRLDKHPLVREADLINLHWISGFVDIPTFFSNINRPIVWTLHDMNPFQGGFHYKNDESNNREQFLNEEKDILKIKSEAYQAKCLKAVISPSNWLRTVSEQSDLLGHIKHYHIPYGLDCTLFKPYPKSIARKVLHLPKNKKIFLFMSQIVANPRKGIEILQKVAQNYSDEKILFVSVGKLATTQKALPFQDKIEYLGDIQNDYLLPLVYSAADVFILPSLEDNLPNTMLESLACGTPVIGFRIGGIEDAVSSAFNGLLADEIAYENLVAEIDKLVEGKVEFDSASIRKDAVKKYDLAIQAKSYIEVYSNLV